jgi:hypothetical protein
MTVRELRNLDHVIRARRSVRGFLSTEVPDTVLTDVLALAQHAPSNCNIQPWLPHVVSGHALRRLRDAMLAAAEACQPYDPDWLTDRKFTGIYRERQIDAAVQLYGAMSVPRDDLSGRRAAYLRNLAFFGAPHAVFVFMSHAFDTREAVDVGMYAQTFMLACTSRGIGTCAQGALGLYPNIVRQHLHVPQSERLLFGISLGYEDLSAKANAARVGRALLDRAVVFHRD